LYEESANILKVLVCGPLEEWGRTQQLRQKCPALAPEQIFGANAGFCRNGCSANNGMLYIYMLIYHREFTSALVVRNGILNVRYFYYPCGARRGIPFNTITAKHFTGQYHETALPGGEGLSFYNARWSSGLVDGRRAGELGG
jgi:hypothetical protein